MIKNLIISDLILTKKLILFYFVIITAMFSYFYLQMDNNSIISGFIIFYISVTAFTIIGREDKFKATATICSLPISKKDYILSKYVLSWFFFVCGFIYMIILAVIISDIKSSPVSLLNIDSIFGALLIYTFCISFSLPFIVRFGLVGMMILLVALQVLGIVSLMTIKLIGSKIDIDGIIKFVTGSFNFLRSSFGEIGYHLFLSIMIVAFNYLSYRITMNIFCKKDL